MSKFVTVLSTNQRGDIATRPAATRLEAFELARQVIDEAIAREKQHDWYISEIVSIRIEAGAG
jgi:hypothetical protein